MSSKITNLPTISKKKLPSLKNDLKWIIEASKLIANSVNVQKEQENIRLAIERKHEQIMNFINTMKMALNYAMLQQHQKEVEVVDKLLEGVEKAQYSGNLEHFKAYLDALVKITTNPGVARAGSEILKNFK
jgi:hypothetical protein